MSATYAVTNTRVDLWTHIKGPGYTSANRCNVSENGKVPVNDLHVTEVTLPFFYWSSKNRANMTTFRNPLNYGAPYKGEPINPDYSGRIFLTITDGDRTKPVQHLKYVRPREGEETQWKYIERASDRMKKGLNKREGHQGVLFRTFIPISTRTLVDTAKSLFPFTGYALDKVIEQKQSGNRFTHFERFFICMFTIIDVVTLAFRLISLLPRALYQHFFQKNQIIEGAKIEGEGKIDWSQGWIQIDAIGALDTHIQQGSVKDYSTDIAISADKICIYLGS